MLSLDTTVQDRDLPPPSLGYTDVGVEPEAGDTRCSVASQDHTGSALRRALPAPSLYGYN